MIPVCEPVIGKKELEYVSSCLKTNWISSQGKYIKEFEEKFAKYCGCRYGISTTSGTTALHLALASLGIEKGDEVILPAFTMIATAFAVIYTGATPVLVDADKETWCMDISQIEKKITKRTKAVLPVHIYGHPCNMEPILKLARKYKLLVIEDSAEAHGAEYKGKKVGGLGDIGCFSFYANKIITTGEGGMVVTNNKKIAEKARLLKDLAFSPKKRFLHLDIGFNYRMTNIQAGMGLAQFERIEEFVNARRKNAELYRQYLKDIKGITLPLEKEWAKNVYWMYGILVEKEFGISRDLLMRELLKKGIETRQFFIPLHKQPVFIKMGLFKNESYPVAEELGKKGMYLPSGSGLREKEIKYIADSIKEIHDKLF
ncbi:MAG: DegT/DnrJ/EryC1/StrS family aminotransferase [Candidatus Omnitrophica bacterium]|nr:DegT/DnrJ/EryC1/StrS family aminotransferase [Candidatus Omnitrophota bacterium]